MDMHGAIVAMGALAHEGRLSVFRLLIQAGHDGMAAGAVSRATGIMPQTLSGHFATLTNAGLLRSRREGKSIIYRIDREKLTDMFAYLLEDCCGGQADLCRPLFDVITKDCAGLKDRCQ